MKVLLALLLACVTLVTGCSSTGHGSQIMLSIEEMPQADFDEQSGLALQTVRAVVAHRIAAGKYNAERAERIASTLEAIAAGDSVSLFTDPISGVLRREGLTDDELILVVMGIEASLRHAGVRFPVEPGPRTKALLETIAAIVRDDESVSKSEE